MATPSSDALVRFPEPANGAVRLYGGDGSPYSNKVLAVLRFRRIPYRWLSYTSPESKGTKDPPGPTLLPKVLFPDDEVMNDSTFLIKEFERRYHGRSVLPCGALGFLSALAEDYFDEWMTKAMFHYRWTYDIETAGFGIAFSASNAADMKTIEAFGRNFAERQTTRLRAVVGSNEVTAPVIEESFCRFCKLLEAHIHAGHTFLFGSRPSAADFALFGQLHPMIALDPETSRRVFAASRTVWFWYHSLKDLSGLSLRDGPEGWFDPEHLPPTLVAILVDMGRLYAPFMTANAQAVAAGKEVQCYLDQGNVPWRQASFKYQAKCVGWLREHWSSLPQEDRRKVEPLLNTAGFVEMLGLTGPSKL